MGIVCSGPSKNFIIPTMNGENGAFTEEVIVRISDEGFTPSKLTLYEGQSILFEWSEESSSQTFNVIQVSGPELNPVPGGYNSGSLSQAGSFKVCLGKKGQFTFLSESLPDRLKTLKVEVLGEPPAEVKITGGGFETQLVNIQEGDTVQWVCENVDSEIPCHLQEMEYCFKHGGFIPRKSRIEVNSTYERTFHNTGLHFFYLEKYDAEWVEGKAALICVVKVTQRNREFSVHPTEEGLQPEFISARVQDRIWLDCSPSKIHGNKILDVYIYKDGFNKNQLVAAKLNGPSGLRIADLVSYQFTEPGLYRYVYNMVDLSQLRGCIVVQPKPTEHVVSIENGRFKPALGTIKQGERVWWTLSNKENFTLYLKEVERCTSAKSLPTRRKSSNSDCGCKKAKDQAKLMSWLGLLSHKFDDIGVFTYWLQNDSDSVSPSNYCSIVVQRNVKHHAIKVRDQGFIPRILNVHPEDWVWWQWQGTARPHNILQVSHQRTQMPGGFDSGKPTCSASAFCSIFTELGVFYFASNGLPEVFGAVVVTPESQVRKIHVTSYGIQPDPLVISVNDCVSWMWRDGEYYNVQEISNPEDVEQNDYTAPSDGLGKRCYSRAISKPGMYHFLCTAHHHSEGELHSQRADSFVHTVLVDPVSYSCMVGVTADGFKPSNLTIAKSQSVLWTWENQGREEHNILHVRPPQDDQPLVRVRGLSAFDSGPVTTRSTFFHTFDVPGRYFITSEGIDRNLSVIDVQENAAYVSPPKIPDTERDGGNVERGYRVCLECDTLKAEIFYTTNGSYPVDCNTEVLHYDKKKGIVLAQAGFVVIRAVGKKEGWVTSQLYTSKRFWVLEADYELQEESDEEAEQHLETGSDEGDLKEQIFNWHWFSCRPTISVELVCDNTFNIDIALGSSADVSWIKGFQLYLNGTSYGGWFSPHCRGLVMSGLIGGKTYHVVLVVFTTRDSFEPQLSNEVVISCPVQSSSGGPLVSLEASTTPQSLVIVWPAYRDPETNEVTAYSVFINGQPFGEQIIPEPESDYCRVLFESGLENEVYTLCVACHLSEDLLLYSNEVEFSLPIPHEILSALQKPTGETASSGRDSLDDGAPARELLLVAEKINHTPSIVEQSSVEKLSVKSSFGKLQTIREGEQLDVIASEADVMDDLPLQDGLETTGDVESEPTLAQTQSEFESLDNEGQNYVADGVRSNVVPDEAPLGASSNVALPQSPVEGVHAQPFEQQPHSKDLDQVQEQSDSQECSVVTDQGVQDAFPKYTSEGAEDDSSDKEDVYNKILGELHPSIFKDIDEIVSIKEPVVTSEETENLESQLPVAGINEAELEATDNNERDSPVLSNEPNDNRGFNETDEQTVVSYSEAHQVSHQNDDSCQANVPDKVGEKLENVSLDKGTGAIGMERSSDEESDSEFWDHGEKQNDEGTAQDDDVMSHQENHAARENDVNGHAVGGNDGVGHATNNGDVHGVKTSSTNVQDDSGNEPVVVSQSKHLEHVDDDVAAQKDGKGECLDETDGVTGRSSVEAESNSETEDFSKALGNSASVNEFESNEERQSGVIILAEEDGKPSLQNTNLSFEEPLESREFTANNDVRETIETAAKLEHGAEAELQSESPQAIVLGNGQELEAGEDGQPSLQNANLSLEEPLESSELIANNDVLETMQTTTKLEYEAEVELQSESPEAVVCGNEQELKVAQNGVSLVEDRDILPKVTESEERSDNSSESSNNVGGVSEQILPDESAKDDKLESEGVAILANETVDVTGVNDTRDRPEEIAQSVEQMKGESPVQNVTAEAETAKDDKLESEWVAIVANETVNVTAVNDTHDRPEEIAQSVEQIKRESPEETWSASSSCGSVKNDADKANGVETTEMPTFEETDLTVDASPSSFGNLGGGEDFKLDRDEEKTCDKKGGQKETKQVAELDASHEDRTHDRSEQPLPRPLLVIKGTTPTTVTLEWEWTLLPEQIAGSDIVYSVLILGSKFHNNINSSFCFNFEESPARSMWPKQSGTLRQHAWRTTNTVIEITGLKQRCNYRLAVLGQLMPCANDSLSRVISFTMPGPPKQPLIHVTDLKDRQVTLSWKPPASYGEASVVGYRLLKDGLVVREDLDSETFNLTISDLEEGKGHRFSLFALTGHSVGDSKPSKAVYVHCPTPPISPQIYHKYSATAGSICIAWKQAEPASTNIPEEHAQCSYSVFVDDILHGEYPLDGMSDIFSDEHTYTIPNLEVDRMYKVCVKCYLNPRVISSGRGPNVHVCGCYGDSSNVLELFCAGPPSPPIVRVSRIDQSGVTLSWSRSREYGGVTLGGYILHVNGKWSGELLPPEQQQTKLTGFCPGDVICVQLAAVTNDLPAQIPALINQEVARSRYFPTAYDPTDSGIESSSSFLSKRSADELKQYACSASSPLVIQYSNLVRTVSSLEIIKIGSRTASITWSLDDTADRSVEPDVLCVMYWKTSEDEHGASKQVVTGKPFKITGLEPGTEYHVMLECVAPHINDENYNKHPINLAQSQSISFKTASVPGPPSNIYVVSATEQSVKLEWDSPTEHGVPVAAIRLNVKKRDQDEPDEGRTFQLSPETHCFTCDGLAAKTEYTFTFEALTEEDLFDVHGISTASVASFCAWTNGLDPPGKVNLESRTPTLIAIKWQPAVAYGMSAIQHYVVHHVPNRQLRKRSRVRVEQAKEAGKELIIESENCEAELRGMEPGTVYRIVVEAVAVLTNYAYDEDFESDDSGTNSVVSSALSEKPPEIQRLYLSQPLLVCTAAPPEPPVLLVSGFTATQIQLSWNRPLLLKPVLDSDCAVGEDPARGRVRHLKGYRLEVNGRVYARLAANKTSITIKKCKSGMKYTCVVVVITSPEKMDGCQRKNTETLDTVVSDTDTDEEIAKSLSDCFEESASHPVEVTLPRQEWGVSLSVRYCANKPAGSLQDSPCSESGDEEGGVVVRWSISELSGDVRGYRLVWYSSGRREKNEVFLPGDANGYEIWSASLSAVYSVYLEILDVREEALAVFGPLHCQTPGPPVSPWIWCRTLSPYQFTIEWNEPLTYGDVKIRGYQVYLNDRRLEKLVDRRQRRVTIHCQSSSVYRVSLVALGSDPQFGDSSPSNVLKLCTPVAQEGIMGRRPSEGVKRPAFDIKINVLSTGNNSISFEWTHPPEIVDTADHYVIKWSSVLKPQVQQLTLPLIQTGHVIDDCSLGTSHFLVVAAVNADGDLVSRSQQCTVQTSAPVEQPHLQLRSCFQPVITIDWRKPTIFGDAEIDYYQLMVNGELQRELEAECNYFNCTDCEPCEQYTFLLKAVSTKPQCDSEWSEPLIVTCPGAETPLVTRIQSKQINCIRVGWTTPLLRGDTQVDSYKVYYLQDKGDAVTSEDIVTHPQVVQHGPLPWHTEDDELVPVPPDSCYWVVLQVELLPEGCRPVFSKPIKTHAAVSPDPPLIRLEIEGVEARRRLEETICELSIRRDRLHRVVHLLESSVVVKGSKLKDLQIANATDTMLEVDSELADTLEAIKEYTATISSVIRWCRPRDDGDAIVSGYQVFVDGNPHGKALSHSALEIQVKLPVAYHVIAVQTLTDHPIGPSPLSNSVELSGREFLPFVLFCYFDVHKRGESWPKSGCCCWDDSHSYELKHRGRTSGRVFVPRGILARRIPCPVFNVMDVFNAAWKPLAPVGVNKMVAVLFWTKWCFSSQKVLEYFLQFAEEFADKFSFVSCCVRSEEPVTSHRQSLVNALSERDWQKTSDFVTHTCGCNPQSQRTRSARRGVISDPDVCQLFGLVGVPTIVLLDSLGYISWHGRCSCRDASSFRTSLLHAFSQVSQSNCPVPSCFHCELDREDEHDTSPSEVGEVDEMCSSRHRKPSVELNSLYQRLHGTSRNDEFLTSPRPFTPQRESRKERVRPKTTTAVGRSARLTRYNRLGGSNEALLGYSRSFSTHSGAQPTRPVTAKPGSTIERTRARTPQTTSRSSSGEVSLPVLTRQRGKRTHPLDRGSAPRVKTKISVENFTL